jgi:hypothetical protein
LFPPLSLAREPVPSLYNVDLLHAQHGLYGIRGACLMDIDIPVDPANDRPTKTTCD